VDLAALHRLGALTERHRKLTSNQHQEGFAMPAFDTPEPIHVTIEIGVGHIRIVASDRNDTVVEVSPSDSEKKGDVAAAEQTQVEYAGGRLLVKAPKGWRHYSFRGGSESIDVEIALPTGSHITAEAGLAAMRCSGRLGECRYKTGAGDIQLDQTGPLHVKTGAGNITVDRVLGPAEITTGSGALQVAGIDGSAVIKNSNGQTWIGDVTGDLRVSSANGEITVDHAYGAVAAKNANGDIRLGEIARGAVVAETGFGKLDVGVREGVAAWLDLSTGFGHVNNNLDAVARPERGEDTVEVRARSGYGDINIRLALASNPT
jgi:hypothetical protein